jgi:hypothetical protein
MRLSNITQSNKQYEKTVNAESIIDFLNNVPKSYLDSGRIK